MPLHCLFLSVLEYWSWKDCWAPADLIYSPQNREGPWSRSHSLKSVEQGNQENSLGNCTGNTSYFNGGNLAASLLPCIYFFQKIRPCINNKDSDILETHNLQTIMLSMFYNAVLCNPPKTSQLGVLVTQFTDEKTEGSASNGPDTHRKDRPDQIHVCLAQCH